jgi:hypothetical protein
VSSPVENADVALGDLDQSLEQEASLHVWREILSLLSLWISSRLPTFQSRSGSGGIFCVLVDRFGGDLNLVLILVKRCTGLDRLVRLHHLRSMSALRRSAEYSRQTTSGS